MPLLPFQMPNKDANPEMAGPSNGAPAMLLKRNVTVRTHVTGLFKERARAELTQEIQMVDAQQRQLEEQYQAALHQLESQAQQGQPVQAHLQQLNQEATERRSQLAAARMELSGQLANIDRLEEGSLMVTGNLENFVLVQLGDDLYDKMKQAEIIIRDGKVVAIQG